MEENQEAPTEQPPQSSEEALRNSINLESLVKSTHTQILSDKEKEITSLVRKVIAKRNGTIIEIDKAEKALSKMRESLKRTQGKIDKIKSGDWSVIAELRKQDGQKQ